MNTQKITNKFTKIAGIMEQLRSCCPAIRISTFEDCIDELTKDLEELEVSGELRGMDIMELFLEQTDFNIQYYPNPERNDCAEYLDSMSKKVIELEEQLATQHKINYDQNEYIQEIKEDIKNSQLEEFTKLTEEFKQFKVETDNKINEFSSIAREYGVYGDAEDPNTLREAYGELDERNDEYYGDNEELTEQVEELEEQLETVKKELDSMKTEHEEFAKCEKEYNNMKRIISMTA